MRGAPLAGAGRLLLLSLSSPLAAAHIEVDELLGESARSTGTLNHPSWRISCLNVTGGDGSGDGGGPDILYDDACEDLCGADAADEGGGCVRITDYAGGYIAQGNYRTCQEHTTGIIGPRMYLAPSGALTAFLFLFLVYLFLGVAVVADKFMVSIDFITNRWETHTTTDEATGLTKTRKVKVPKWNQTVANLTLLALGSSAPEILLAVIDTVSALDQEPGELGPSTIVGSAAFNLLVICAACIVAPPSYKRTLIELIVEREKLKKLGEEADKSGGDEGAGEVTAQEPLTGEPEPEPEPEGEDGSDATGPAGLTIELPVTQSELSLLSTEEEEQLKPVQEKVEKELEKMGVKELRQKAEAAGVDMDELRRKSSRKVRQLQVFWCTAFASVFAYIWLVIVLELWSPDEVTVTEAFITLACFPVLVIVAYFIDKREARSRAKPTAADAEHELHDELGSVMDEHGSVLHTEASRTDAFLKIRHVMRKAGNRIHEGKEKVRDRVTAAMAAMSLYPAPPITAPLARIDALRAMTGQTHRAEAPAVRSDSDLVDSMMTELAHVEAVKDAPTDSGEHERGFCMKPLTSLSQPQVPIAACSFPFGIADRFRSAPPLRPTRLTRLRVFASGC